MALNGNVIAITDAATGRNQRGNRDMTYDALDRLTDVASPMYGSTGAHYSYDALDNLTHVTAPGRNWDYCYDEYNRLTNVKTGSCNGATVIGLGYDPQGNLANKNGQAYHFDYGNRLRGATGQESYRYDGYGRRILAYRPGQGNILSLYGADGVLRYQHNQRIGKSYNYVYLGGSLIGKRSYDTGTHAQTYTFIHTDALGSPAVVTASNRVVLERREYEPYGQQLAPTPPVDGPGYAGHVYDAATGLNYMQQRYYDPRIGRFLSVDPVTALSSPVGAFNRYHYAANNPYRFTDPDGRQTAKIHKDDTEEERQAALAERRRRESQGRIGGAGASSSPLLSRQQSRNIFKISQMRSANTVPINRDGQAIATDMYFDAVEADRGMSWVEKLWKVVNGGRNGSPLGLGFKVVKLYGFEAKKFLLKDGQSVEERYVETGQGIISVVSSTHAPEYREYLDSQGDE